MSESTAQPGRTEHALLVLLGQYAQHLGLTQALMAVPLHQKAYVHTPQTKVLEFLVAILAGLPYLEDISRDARPLDQDQAVAHAWQQTAWADYSGVGRTLQALTQADAEAIGRVLGEISQRWNALYFLFACSLKTPYKWLQARCLLLVTLCQRSSR